MANETLTPSQAAARLLLPEQMLADLAAGLVKSDETDRHIEGPPVLDTGGYRAGDVEMYRNSGEYTAALRRRVLELEA